MFFQHEDILQAEFLFDKISEKFRDYSMNANDRFVLIVVTESINVSEPVMIEFWIFNERSVHLAFTWLLISQLEGNIE